MNRIEKLLASEYSTFREIILVESTFAEINETGYGIKQVHLGLTPKNLIIASDTLEASTASNIYCYNIDPETETLEIISIYPLKFISISISDRSHRKVIKTTFPNQILRYFELGGFEKRKLLWILWCERIYYMNPNKEVLSTSEISAATNHQKQQLYETKKIKRGISGKYQIWNYFFAIHREYQIEKRTWNDKYLYLGKKIEKGNENKPKPIPGLGQTASVKSLYIRNSRNITITPQEMFNKITGKMTRDHRKYNARKNRVSLCVV